MEKRVLSDSDLKAKWDYEAIIAYAAELAYEKAYNKSKMKTKLTIAARLKKLGISIEDISKATKLTPEEIESL